MIKRVFRKFALICELILISLAMLTFFTPVQAAVADFDRYYPSYTDLEDFLNDLDASPIVSTETIGLSIDAKNIVAIKISDNPDVEEDEPGFLFIGVIHGNEPLGLRVVLELIETLTESYGSDPEVTNWVNAYEIWIVPVLNPYGYDNSLRKNGPDASGVDLNRNFNFRWDHDNVGTTANSNKYKGPWAASEPETQAISDFVVAQRPVFGITFHSGTGGNDGLIYYPWNPNNWGLVNQDPPDRDRIIAIRDVIADAVEAYRGFTNRPATDNAGAIGQSNVYNYAVTGMFDYMLETGYTKWSREDQDGDNNEDYPFLYDVDLNDYNSTLTTAQQNDFADAEALVDAYHEGITGLMRYFLFDDAGGFSFRGSGVTGVVTDCATGAPLSATVQVFEIDNTDGDTDLDDDDLDLDGDGDLDTEFRISEPIFGRYMRLLEPGTWNLHFDLTGYDLFSTPVTVVDNATSGVELIQLDVALDPGIDTDGDGLRDCEEIQVHLTDPDDSDTDGDGYSDGEEIAEGTDPTDPLSFPNEPPIADAGPDQTVEQTSTEGAEVTLDGTGSSDPNGDSLTYSWSWNGGSASGMNPAVIMPPGHTTVTLTVSDGEYSSIDTCDITVEDTTPPDITCPSNAIIECDQSPDPAVTDSASAIDMADPNVTITFTDTVESGTCSEESTITRTWTATDDSGNSSSCVQKIEVVDTTPPDIQCNAPSTITPTDAPVSFTATATDNCAGDPSVEIIGYECFMFTKKGKRIDKTESCIVQVNGDTVTILDSGGVNDNITWTVRANDNCGNVAESTCSVTVVNPVQP